MSGESVEIVCQTYQSKPGWKDHVVFLDQPVGIDLSEIEPMGQVIPRIERDIRHRTIGEERLDWILFSTPHTSISTAIETITNRLITMTNDQQVHIVLLKTKCHQTKQIVLSQSL